MELARRCQFREDHGTHVARLALSIFDQTRRLHRLADGRRRAARVRGAPARHRLLHLAPPPPPPQRLPDPEPRHDRVLARGGADHRARRALPPQGRAAARARGPMQAAVQGRLAGGCAIWRPSCASRTRSTGRTRAWCGRCAARSPRAPSRSASTPTAIPSSSCGPRGARATCSRSWPSASCASPSMASRSARSSPRGRDASAGRPSAWSGRQALARARAARAQRAPRQRYALDAQRAQAEVHRGGDQRGRLDGEQPGPDDPQRHAPADAGRRCSPSRRRRCRR